MPPRPAGALLRRPGAALGVFSDGGCTAAAVRTWFRALAARPGARYTRFRCFGQAYPFHPERRTIPHGPLSPVSLRRRPFAPGPALFRFACRWWQAVP